MKSILASALAALAQGNGRFRGVFARWALLLPVLLAAAGCSTINVAYTGGPTVLGFVADSYLDLDSDQSAALKTRILAVREWNRSTHLVEYARFFAEVRARAAGPVSPDDVAWAVAEARKRWAVMAERVAAEIADLAPQLNAENFAALRKKLDKNTADFIKDVIKQDPERQRKRRFERVRGEAERWYGDFDDDQLERIRAWTDALPVNYALMLENRRRRQADFLAALTEAAAKGADRAAVRQRLFRLLTDWEAGRSPAYQAVASQYQAASYRLAADIANLATPAQRATAQRRTQRWIDDIAALGARPGP
ncbi:MAG: hypothetical protein JNM90_18395 [Burkholderiales bacterium]|nr:hypothetical protein [Burkholderiales bacterium]